MFSVGENIDAEIEIKHLDIMNQTRLETCYTLEEDMIPIFPNWGYRTVAHYNTGALYVTGGVFDSGSTSERLF